MFDRKHYYPVKIGDMLQDRFRIIAKLGYGAYSTVWLARDERSKTYASLKICTQHDTEMSPVANEVKMLRRLGDFARESDHPGLDFTRLAHEIFEVDGPRGRHHCIAAKPQGCSLRTLQTELPNAALPKCLVKSIVHRLLFSLNWLHATCGVIHTDISPQNVLMEVQDEAIFQLIEHQESQDPSKPIMCENGLYHKSRNPLLEVSGIPILTDFGQMRSTDMINNDWWMPDLYRAPEVLLKLPWSYTVDIWSIGVMILELLEGRNLFDPVDRVHDQYVLPLALAQYIGYLGLPPLAMIEQSPLFLTYFDDRGNWRSEPPIPQTNLEDFVTTIPHGEEKALFMNFIRKILVWDPEARATSSEIIHDEWLMTPVDDVIQTGNRRRMPKPVYQC